MKAILIFIALCFVALTDPSPPIYDYSFYTSFDDTFVIDGTSYQVNGQEFYDPKNNR